MGHDAHTKPYEVHTALGDDLNEGWVWVRDSGLKDQLRDQRRIVRIEFNSKKVYCEALYADDYYLKRFNERRVKDGRTEIPLNKDLVFINGCVFQSRKAAVSRALSIRVEPRTVRL